MTSDTNRGSDSIGSVPLLSVSVTSGVGRGRNHVIT
jgi:hypothetical protein